MNGELREVDGRWQLVFVRRLPHSPQKVWQALTDNDHLAAWFPTDIEGQRAAGAPLRFVFRENEAPPVDGRMLTYDPPSVLEFSWADGEELRFELQPDGEGTLLTFVNTIAQLGKAARDGAGWHTCLDVLTAHLDGTLPDRTPERWKQVHAGYVATFGPDASTIGPPESR